jgi:YggT family protein
MSGSASIIYLFLSACQFIILLRFFCQACKVNYYNPVTQSIVKLSGYLVKPFEYIGLNLTPYFLFIILFLFTFLKLYLPLIFNSQTYPLSNLLIISLGYLLRDIINIYWYLIVISAIKSWFNVFVSHPIFGLVDELCEPIYRITRSIVPALSGIDFSPIIILVLLQILEIVLIPRIFNLTSLL